MYCLYLDNALYISVYILIILVVTHQEKENFYIVVECDAIYISRTFNLWLLLVIIDRSRSRTRTPKATWKWRVVPMYGYATPFWRHFHVVFDVRVLDLNLSNIHKDITRLWLVDFSAVNPKQQCMQFSVITVQFFVITVQFFVITVQFSVITVQKWVYLKVEGRESRVKVESRE
jgi:hypothetical protein